MKIKFIKIDRNEQLPLQAYNEVYLQPDNWDDFGYKTLFTLTVFNEQGNKQPIGNVKIGFTEQGDSYSKEHIPSSFETLTNTCYSLGQDADYYKKIVESLSEELRNNILMTLGDVVHDSNRFSIAQNEDAFNTSLMRTISNSTICQQFRRILRGEAALTEYDFSYERMHNDYSAIKLDFKIEPNSKPSSNIHILIGRNGVGKTTLLNNMVDALIPNRGVVEDTGFFSTIDQGGNVKKLHDSYFSGIVSVSFSAFDLFNPPTDQPDANAGMRYFYVGLKKMTQEDPHQWGLKLKKQMTQEDPHQWGLKDKCDLCKDFTTSLKLCFSLTAKKDRWVNAVRKLESDFNFSEMDLWQINDKYADDSSEDKQHFSKTASRLFNKMSSGHAIVLLSITKLVETVEEKTLVLLDEPESHLHPPLLSAFTRALSDLLVNRNGVAIIATHSPVVLQEVPKSCVSILRRTRLDLNVDRPESETFAENVGVLTREVFGLEVSKSGFHDLLTLSVNEGKSYEEIAQEYHYQLGFEGKALLRSMILIRDSKR